MWWHHISLVVVSLLVYPRLSVGMQAMAYHQQQQLHQLLLVAVVVHLQQLSISYTLYTV